MQILKRNLQIKNGLLVSLSDLEDIILVLTSKKKQNLLLTHNILHISWVESSLRKELRKKNRQDTPGTCSVQWEKTHISPPLKHHHHKLVSIK